jgi:DNA polymerase III epsilon subunit-like protein
MALLTIVMVAALVLLAIRLLNIPPPPSSDTGQNGRELSSADRFRDPMETKVTDAVGLASRAELNLALFLPRFAVFDLETTGLDPVRNEIIEIGAIRINRDSGAHDTFRKLVKPIGRIPKLITRINGISQDMVDSEGIPLEQALREFVGFIGDLPLVSFNADFDMAFLRNAAAQHGLVVSNSVSCALNLARLAWPSRESYKLCDFAKDAGLSDVEMHSALNDCQLALLVYIAAASILGAATAPADGRDPEMQFGPSPRMLAFRQNSRILTDPVERNLLGMELEADGQTDLAIGCYQANVREGFEGNHPYDRLAVIFRRRKDVPSEVAVLTRAIEVFSQLRASSRSDVAAKLEKFRHRLRRVPTHLNRGPTSPP